MNGRDSMLGRVAVLIGFALVVAGLLYALFIEFQREERVAPASAPGAQRTSATTDAPAAASMPPRPQMETKLGEDETILCGYGRIKRSEADRVQQDAAQEADRTLDGLKERLAASKDPREVALGLYLKGSTDALAAMATGHGDPSVYALSLLACGRNASSACAFLSARQWAAIEPDNGFPWLLTANTAGADKEARNQAVVRASAAQYFNPRFPDFLGMLRWPLLREQAPQTHSALADQLAGMQVALPMVPYGAFIQFCSDPSVELALRTKSCSDLSNLLLQDRSLHGFSTGVTLAELSGSPRDRVERLRQTRDAYQAAYAQTDRSDSQAATSDCDAIAAFDQFAADYSRGGEIGIAVKRIEEARAKAESAKVRR